jgi:hypothetical protein
MMTDPNAAAAFDELRREIKTIWESQERLSSWLIAVGALLRTLGEQESERLNQLRGKKS